MGKTDGKIGMAKFNKMNKKGSLIDIIFIMVGLLVFASAVLISFKVVSEFNDNVQASDAVPTEAKAATGSLQGHYTGVLDKSALFLAIGMAIGAFILASLVRVHPIFMPFYFIALVFVIFFCGIFSNIYQEMAETPALAAQADSLVIISYILEYMPFIVGILGTILAIVMYKLWSNSQMM